MKHVLAFELAGIDATGENRPMPLASFNREIASSDTPVSPFKLRPIREVLRDKDHGWSPLLWVIYLGFFFIDPVMQHASTKIWAIDVAGALVFLLLYFGLFALERPRSLFHIVGMVLLGIGFMPINTGACTFFIFAASMLPFCIGTQMRAVAGLGIIGAIGAIEAYFLYRNGWVLFYSGLFPIFIGAGNTFFAERNRMNRKLRKANEEIEHLATVAERERIARDLHDVLGHTLSVITLKSELAGKLIDRDPQRAGKEIREVEEISRQALSEVRDAIRGYRTKGIAAEMAQAKATLETAGLTVQCEAATTMHLPAMQESVLSLALREAVTNVVRHARAANCRMRIEQQNGTCRLEIADDGQGFVTTEGNGLRGMRERVEMLGGTLDRRNKSGTTLTITLPLREMVAKEFPQKEVAAEQKAPQLEPSH
jgi:two-component system, NarL family, sensor histidine kinase DesK